MRSRRWTLLRACLALAVVLTALPSCKKKELTSDQKNTLTKVESMMKDRKDTKDELARLVKYREEVQRKLVDARKEERRHLEDERDYLATKLSSMEEKLRQMDIQISRFNLQLPEDSRVKLDK